MGAEGGCPSNTHPLSSHVSLAGRPECSVSGGIDWLEWSAKADWDEWQFQKLVKQLEKEKQSLQSGSKQNAWLDLADNVHLEVGRTGMGSGGSRGQHFEYRVDCRGITLGIAKRNDPDLPQPNLRVVVPGKACLFRGAWQCYEFVHKIVGELGGAIRDEKLSRVDSCLDIAGFSVVELQDAVEDRAFISRSRTVMTYKNLVRTSGPGSSRGKSRCGW